MPRRTTQLTEHEVLTIKRRLMLPPRERPSARELAIAFNVSAESIRRIARGETWGWLEPDTYVAKQRAERESVDKLLKELENPDGQA